MKGNMREEHRHEILYMSQLQWLFPEQNCAKKCKRVNYDHYSGESRSETSGVGWKEIGLTKTMWKKCIFVWRKTDAKTRTVRYELQKWVKWVLLNVLLPKCVGWMYYNWLLT